MCIKQITALLCTLAQISVVSAFAAETPAYSVQGANDKTTLVQQSDAGSTNPDATDVETDATDQKQETVDTPDGNKGEKQTTTVDALDDMQNTAGPEEEIQKNEHQNAEGTDKASDTAAPDKPDTTTSTLQEATANPNTSVMQIMPSPHKLMVGKKEASPQAYLINGYNYFKLRDIALIMRETDFPFDVSWDNEKRAVNLTPNQKYTVVGGEMATSSVENLKVLPSTGTVLLEGKEVSFTGYMINNNNYYRIVDIADTMSFPVSYDNDTRTVHITSTSAEEPSETPDNQSNPTTPSDPAATTPTTPTTPVDPTTPTTPVDPTTPTTPVDPTTPTTPVDPTTPTTPIDPTTPSTPTTPTMPTTPVFPTMPFTPDPSFKPGIYRVNVSTTLTIRSGPGTDYPELGEYTNGDCIVVDSLSNGWAHVKNGHYCSSTYLNRTCDYPPAPSIPPRTSQIDGKMTVILDAGHGGTDRGAINPTTDLDEKHVNLYVSEYLKQYLEDAGVNVIMVRNSLEEGSSLSDRGAVTKDNIDNADLFFSVHHNASDTTAQGSMVLCQIADEDGGPSKLLAEELGAEYEKLGMFVRNPWFRIGMSGDYYYVNRQAASLRLVSVISEFCFIDNDEDLKFIDSDEDWQKEARAQCNAILSYFEQTEY